MPTNVPTNNAANHQESGCLPSDDGKPDPMEATPQEARDKNAAGAPRGNSNAGKHMLHGSKLPNDCKPEEMKLYAFRKYARTALAAVHGDIGLYHEALLQSAIRHETRALLAHRWLRLKGDSLELSERLALLKTISDATDSRDKCLKNMGLDRLAIDPEGVAPWSLVKDATAEELP